MNHRGTCRNVSHTSGDVLMRLQQAWHGRRYRRNIYTLTVNIDDSKPPLILVKTPTNAQKSINSIFAHPPLPSQINLVRLTNQISPSSIQTHLFQPPNPSPPRTQPWHIDPMANSNQYSRSSSSNYYQATVDVAARSNIQASAYTVDAVTMALKGFHYSTCGAGGTFISYLSLYIYISILHCPLIAS